MNTTDDSQVPGTLELQGDRRSIDVWFGFGMAVVGLVGWCVPGLIDLPTMTVEIAGVILAVSGVAVVLFRNGAVIDNEALTVTRWWGLPMPV